jgi:hypothetical protein
MGFLSLFFKKMNLKGVVLILLANLVLVMGYSNCSDIRFTRLADTSIASEPGVLSLSSCQFNGQVLTNGQRIRAFQSSSVQFSQECNEESRVCTNGALSGSYVFASCGVEAPVACLFNGETIQSGQKVAAYQNSSPIYGQTCQQETRSCLDGTLSGSYSYATCTMEAPASCLFNGQTIPSGQSISAYQNSSVAYGLSCSMETRTCLNGVLSGNFSFGSCAVSAPASCLFNGQTISSSQTVKAYQSSSVLFGQICQEESRSCLNGSLSGSFNFASCDVGAPVACLFNGQTIVSGQVVSAFKSSSVPYGTECTTESRSCLNGALSGSFTFASCAVAAPAACLFDGKTIVSGQNVTTFQSPSVAYGSSCVSEVDTCSNGVLGGVYRSPSCVVEPAPVERLSAPLLLVTALDKQVQLGWSVVSGASRYVVSRSTDNKNFTQIADLNGTSFLDTGLTNNTLYYYSLVAFDALGNQGFPAVISVKPVGVGQPGYGLTHLLLKWGAVPNASYKLTRDDITFCPTVNSSAQCIQNRILYNGATELSYLDTVIMDATIYGHSYNYNLAITLNDGTVTTRSFYFDSGAYNSLYIAQGEGGIDIVSRFPPANSLGTYNGFTIYRDDGNGGNIFSKIGNDTSASFKDVNVVSGNTYCYTIQFNYLGAGSSAPMSSGAYGKTCVLYLESKLTGTLSGRTLTLNWGAVSNAKYTLTKRDQRFCPTENNSAYCEASSLLYDGNSQTSFSDPNLILEATTAGHSYYYNLAITLSNGSTVSRDFYFDSGAYNSLYIAQGTGGIDIVSRFTPANSLGTYIGFSIYRNDGNGGNVFSKIGNDTSASFKDINVVSGNTYCYAIQFNYSVGSSAPMSSGANGKACVVYVDSELTGTLSGNTLNLKWGAVNNAKYTLTKRDQRFCPTENSSAYCEASSVLYTGTSQTSFSDTNLILEATTAGHSYYYSLAITLSNGSTVSRDFYFDSGAYNSLYIAQGTGGIDIVSRFAPANSLGTYLGFTIYRDDGNGGTVFTKIGNDTSAAFKDQTVVTAHTYCYAIQFNYSFGSSAPMSSGAYGKSCVVYVDSNLTGGLTK